jgi:hypothetical protein
MAETGCRPILACAVATPGIQSIHGGRRQAAWKRGITFQPAQPVVL